MNVALWFLPCLFIVAVIFYPIKKKYLLFIFPIAGYMVTFLPFRLPWSFDVALTAVVFYAIGNLYKDTWLDYKALPLLFLFHLVFCFLNTPVDMNYLVYGNIFFFYISACSGVLFFSVLFKYLKKNTILEYIGRNTIIIIGLLGITWFILEGVSHLLFKRQIRAIKS